LPSRACENFNDNTAVVSDLVNVLRWLPQGTIILHHIHVTVAILVINAIVKINKPFLAVWKGNCTDHYCAANTKCCANSL